MSPEGDSKGQVKVIWTGRVLESSSSVFIYKSVFSYCLHGNSTTFTSRVFADALDRSQDVLFECLVIPVAETSKLSRFRIEALLI